MFVMSHNENYVSTSTGEMSDVRIIYLGVSNNTMCHEEQFHNSCPPKELNYVEMDDDTYFRCNLEDKLYS